jgi:tetratricopeptide (TPR) repeat protein
VLAPLVAEWRLLAIADAAGLLERLGAAAEAETLRRQVLAGSARTAAHVLELVGLLVRQQRVTEALELVGENWSRLDTLTAAATVSNIVRDAKLPAGKLQETRTRVIEAAAEETLPERQARLQLLIGDISQTMADWEGALAAYSRVTEIEPTNVVGLNNTAFMTAKLHKNPELARGAIQQAIKLAGALPDLLDTSASVSIETGSPQTALQDLRNSPELERRGGLQARLAEALWQVGQKKEAVEAWSRARKLGWTLEQSHPLDRERHAEIDRADPAEAAPPQ